MAELASREVGSRIDGSYATLDVGASRDQDREANDAYDASGDERTEGGTSEESSSTLLVRFLRELDRGAQIDCPCKAKKGDFPSEQACVAATGYRPSDIECLRKSVAEVPDSPARRLQLVCEINRAKQRNDCHEVAACEEDAVSGCDVSQLECPPPDVEVLTKALTDCPGASVLGRGESTGARTACDVLVED